MVLPFIMLIVQDGFRWEIGTDWEPYYTFFENVNILGDDTEFEIGYVYLNKFISSIGGNYTLFLIVHALILYSMIFAFTKKYSYYPLVSIFLYYAFYISVMGMNRQFLAVVFALFSVKYILNRDAIKFGICIALGCLFHLSILMFIPAFFCKFNVKTKVCIGLGIFALLFSLSGVLNLIPSEIFLFMGDNSAAKVSFYLGQGAESHSIVNSLLSLLRRSTWLILLLIFRCKFVNHPQWSDKFNLCFNLYFLSTLIYIMFDGSNFQIVVSRGLIYYNIFEIVMIPYVLTFFQGRTNKFFAYVVIILYAMIMMNKGMSSYTPVVGDIFNPYKSVLF